MEKIATNIHGSWRLKPTVFRDTRGFFLEAWNRRTFADAGWEAEFVQDNHSRSAQFVLRGLHYQSGPHAQDKLVWVTSGVVFDVIVDLRRSSPTFGRWDGYRLDAESHERLWVPKGCAHGFLVLSEMADFHYKCTSFYTPAAERSLRWDDPSLAIAWPLPPGVGPLVSEKDAAAPLFADCEKFD